MADTKLADLTALTTPSGDDILYIVDDPAGTPLDRKIALDNLFTRGTITADAPVLNMSQTWNNGAVTFTGLKFNANTGSSASGSLLLDLQTNTGGAATSQFKVRKDGVTTVGNNLDIVYEGTTRLSIWPSLSQALAFRSDNFIAWSSTTTVPGTADVILGRRAAANLRLGAADVGATTATVTITIAAPGVVTWSSHGFSTGTPVVFTTTGALPTGITAGTTYYAVVVTDSTFQLASSVANAIAATPTVITTSGSQSGTHTGTRYNITQRLSMQGVTGVTDRLGADLFIQGSQGTGTGAGGSIIFQVAPAGGTSNAVQNALATALTINTNQTATLARTSGTDSAVDLQFAGTANTGWWSPGGTTALVASFAGTRMMDIRSAGVSFSNGTILLGAVGGNQSILVSDAANTLALRNGNNGQTFRLYGRFTDITNDFERFFIEAPTTSGAAVLLGTQKGATTGAARALEFQTDGTTRLTIDTSGNVVVPIADNSGTVRFGGASSGTTFGVDEDGSLLVRRLNSSAFGLAMGSRGGSDGHALAIGASTFMGFASVNQPDGDSTLDVRFGRAAAGIASLYGTGGTGAALELYEQTAPAAPAANGVRIYAVDNGSGKTQLMALFATGAAQQIAIEP